MKRKIMINAFVLVMSTAILLTPLAAYAAFTQPGFVNGDGVRLRKTPGDGTILELMYKGEPITIDSSAKYPGFSAWVYVRREKTLTTGWMEWSYFVHE